jgi:hypothetical protein
MPLFFPVGEGKKLVTRQDTPPLNVGKMQHIEVLKAWNPNANIPPEST